MESAQQDFYLAVTHRVPLSVEFEQISVLGLKLPTIQSPFNLEFVNKQLLKLNLEGITNSPNLCYGYIEPKY